MTPNLIQWLYRAARPVLFSMDPETAHNLTVAGLRLAADFRDAAALMEDFLRVDDPRLAVSVRSLSVRNPVGLGAGFDKRGELASILPALGFGFAELGTFTPLPQEGQKKPRLFRYPRSRAIVNRMGFNNPGVKVAAERIARERSRLSDFPIGVNIGKGRDTPIEEALADYLTAFEHLAPHGDYIALNVSSPNTPNLRNLQEIASLTSILKAICERNRAMAERTGEAPKLVFTKVSPDCNEELLEEIARLAVETRTGLIATNTTLDHSALKARTPQAGGLSGHPLRARATNVLKKLYKSTRGVVPIIGVGGIFSAEDAYERIRAGASLVQVYSGWIFQGPALVPDINRGLLRLIEKDGFKTVQEAVGTL